METEPMKGIVWSGGRNKSIRTICTTLFSYTGVKYKPKCLLNYTVHEKQPMVLMEPNDLLATWPNMATDVAK